MVDRQVTASGKNGEGDITGLCGSWGSVEKAAAILQIEAVTHRYFVHEQAPPVDVRVVTEGGKKYLRTVSDDTNKNNLDNLPDC